MILKTANQYFKEKFGTKVYRLSLSSGCTCPNRDGTLSHRGCIFCSEGGSGDFASSFDSIDVQIENARKKVDSKFPSSIKPEDRKYIAYFQSYTNTYGNIERLTQLYTETALRKEIAAVSIGTRPDCIGEAEIEMLKKINSIKPVTVELGLQTIHEKTAILINRCSALTDFENAYRLLKSAGIEVIVHVILGLPGETEEMMKETVRYLSCLNPVLDGIKIQLLHVLKNTELAKMYEKNPFHIFTMEEYCNLVVECLKLLDPRTVIHRMTGDGAKKDLIAPLWSGDKKRVLNYLNKKIFNS